MRHELRRRDDVTRQRRHPIPVVIFYDEYNSENVVVSQVSMTIPLSNIMPFLLITRPINYGCCAINNFLMVGYSKDEPHKPKNI